MRSLLALAAITLWLASPVTVRAAEKHWQTGACTKTDVSRQIVDFGPGSSPFGAPNQSPKMQAMADVRVYVIETSTLRLELKDVVPVGRRSLDLAEGDPVTFALEKNTVYIRDSSGVEHKLRVTKKTAK